MQKVESMKLVVPNGGWGWVILFAAVMVNLLIPGTIKSFGVLCVEFLKVFEVTPTQASWVPALCYFFYASLGPLSSILSIKYSYRSVTIVGGSLAASGLMLSYFANSLTFLYFSYGIMVGMGAGLAFPVTIYIVSEYFDRLRGVATGLCISGSAIGTIIWPPLLQYLIQTLGYRGAVLTMGGILLLTLACACLYHPVEQHMKLVSIEDDNNQQSPSKNTTEKEIYDDMSHRSSIITVGPVTLDPRHDQRIRLSRRIAAKQQQRETSTEAVEEVSTESQEEEPRPSLFDLSILRDPLYLVILISSSTSAISNTNFMILLPVYAVFEGYDKESAALLLSIVSLLDLIGRIGGASLSDINLMPKHYYFVGGLGLSGVALAILPMANDYIFLATFCALFGLGSGLYIGTTAVVLADILGPERLTSSYGISMFVNGFLQLIGPPIINAIFERIGSFRPIFLTLGMILVCGTALWGALPLIRRKNEKEMSSTVQQNPA